MNLQEIINIFATKLIEKFIDGVDSNDDLTEDSEYIDTFLMNSLGDFTLLFNKLGFIGDTQTFIEFKEYLWNALNNSDVIIISEESFISGKDSIPDYYVEDSYDEYLMSHHYGVEFLNERKVTSISNIKNNIKEFIANNPTDFILQNILDADLIFNVEI